MKEKTPRATIPGKPEDLGGPSRQFYPDNIKPTPEAVDALRKTTTLDLEAIKKAKPYLNKPSLSVKEDLLSGDFSKPHERLIYTRYLLKSSLLLLVKEKKADHECTLFLKWLFEKVRGDWTSRILFFIIEHKATTFKELKEATNASEQMIDYMLKEMRRWGLIESKGYVKKPYIELKGRAPRIFSTIDATIMDLTNAQRRYAVITLGYDPHEKEQINQARLAEAEKQIRLDAIAARVEADQIQKYVDSIASSLEPHHAGWTKENRRIIEAHMKEAGVPNQIWVQVRDGTQHACLHSNRREANPAS